jgi:NAD(P)-dependent dehydrogenase (short-subunit alcohol dehydrogenase family)
MANLRNQAAIITGGGSGIGLAIAAAIVAEGMAVTLAGRDEKKLRLAAAQLEQKGGKVLVVPVDVSVAAHVERLIEKTIKAFGRIDLLVNNAGIFKMAPVVDLAEADWDAIQATNLKGAFLCAKAVLPVMMKQGSGYIINIASVAGKTGFGGASAYCASKFGMIGLTESLLEEAVPHHIRVTAICPGYVATPMTAKVPISPDQMIPPEDIGKLVVDLLQLSPVTVIKEIVVQRIGSIGE